MVSVEYMHLCDYAFTTEDWKPCMIGVFATIAGMDFPLVHSKLFVAVQFRGSANERFVDLRAEVGRPNSAPIGAITVPAATAGSDGGVFVCFEFVSLAFPEQGRYVGLWFVAVSLVGALVMRSSYAR